MLALDPGSTHCGIAVFDGGRCVRADTLRPNMLFQMLEKVDEKVWVCEEWRSYPWRNKPFDPVVTAEVIGVIKYLARKRRRELYMQPAMIKKPTAARVRAAEIELLPGTIHCQDAQLHGWYWTMNPAGRGATLWVN